MAACSINVASAAGTVPGWSDSWTCAVTEPFMPRATAVTAATIRNGVSSAPTANQIHLFDSRRTRGGAGRSIRPLLPASGLGTAPAGKTSRRGHSARVAVSPMIRAG